MGTTTFSGPIRAGTPATAIGYTVMMQTHTMDMSGGAIAAAVTAMVIPAKSKIVNIIVDMATAANTGSNISVGDSTNGAATFVNTLASGTTAVLKTITTQGGGALSWGDTGAVDLTLTVTNSAATNAGVAVITVMYAQAYNVPVRP